MLTSGCFWQDRLDGINRWPLISGGLSQQRAAWAGMVIWTTHLMPGSYSSWQIVRNATVVTANRSDVTGWQPLELPSSLEGGLFRRVSVKMPWRKRAGKTRGMDEGGENPSNKLAFRRVPYQILGL